MFKKSNSKEKTITIKAVYPISLEELSVHVLKQGEDKSLVFNLLNNKPEVVNIKIKKVIKEIICRKKLNIKIKRILFFYNDSDNYSHGASYFKIKLRGTERELKKIAGEDKICFYDWNEKN